MSEPLSSCRINDLIAATDAAMDVLVDSCLEVGHGPAPPLAGGVLEDVTTCLSCEAPWPCPPVSQIIAAERAILVALQTLGADVSVVDQADLGGDDRRPCSRGPNRSPFTLSSRGPHRRR